MRNKLYSFQATNSYHPDNSPGNIYKPNQCIQKELMTRILKYCKCYLDYIGELKARDSLTRTDRPRTRSTTKRSLNPCSKPMSWYVIHFLKWPFRRNWKSDQYDWSKTMWFLCAWCLCIIYHRKEFSEIGEFSTKKYWQKLTFASISTKFQKP